MARFKISQVVLIAGAFALVGVGGYAGYWCIAQRPAQAAAIATADAQVGTITATVNATGNVAAPTQAKLSFSSSGRLVQLLVTLGDHVTAGQPLAKLDDADLQVALQQAQAGYTSAVAKLEQTKAGSRPEDLQAAQAQVDSAKAKLAQLQDQPKTANPNDLANAQLAVQQAQVTYDKALADAAVKTALIQLQQAQNNLGKLQQQGPTDWDLRQAQEAANAAQANLDKLVHPSPTDLQQAQAAGMMDDDG